jgi:enoyl-CoA hydratase/carnithine racemase
VTDFVIRRTLAEAESAFLSAVASEIEPRRTLPARPCRSARNRCKILAAAWVSFIVAFENIQLELVDGVARLTLARPAALNAFNRPMLRELLRAFEVIRGDSAIRVLLLRGAGRAFSSGADLSSGSSAAGSPGFDAGAVLEEYYNPLIEQMFDLRIPIVAGVQGPAVGAGCIRRGVRGALESSLHETLQFERSAQREAGNTADFAEGLAAFRQKRPPRFTGR